MKLICGGLNQAGQATLEYMLATLLFMSIFVFLHQVIDQALKKLFANAAFIILSAYK